MFEPHTQLYKRGKAGEPVQFGRLALIYEDGVGVIAHAHLLGREEHDRDVVVTPIVNIRIHSRPALSIPPSSRRRRPRLR